MGASILFVGTKRAASNIIKEEAIRCGMPYVNHRWLGGMMTNYKTIKASIKRLKDLEFLAEENFSQYSKKEALAMTREMEKLERSLGGIKDLGGIPDVIFVVDIGHERNAVREAHTLQLPIIGVVDSNHNPEGIDYMIAGNDDSIRAISYYAREIANAVLEAKASISTKKVSKAKDKKPAAKTEALTETEDKKPAAKTEAVTETEVKKPATKKAETKKPATKKAETKKPATKKAETKKPATKKAETKKPATKKAETKKPATKKAETKKPATKKAETKKPATKKPAAKKSEAKDSEET